MTKYFYNKISDILFNRGEFQWQKMLLIFAPSIKIMHQQITFKIFQIINEKNIQAW